MYWRAPFECARKSLSTYFCLNIILETQIKGNYNITFTHHEVYNLCFHQILQTSKSDIVRDVFKEKNNVLAPAPLKNKIKTLKNTLSYLPPESSDALIAENLNKTITHVPVRETETHRTTINLHAKFC